ncbi:MAG: DUF362 domain-containing protein [Candidatus Hodarchaeota archaeon]
MSKVAVIKKEGMSIQDTVKKTLDAIDAQSFLKKHQSFLLKPNYIIAESPLKGNITSPETIEGVLQYLIDLGFSAKNIIIGEGGYPGITEKAFDIAGIRPIVKKYDIRLINLNKDEKVKVHCKNPLSLREVTIAKTALDVDAIISIPSLKVHGWSKTTLCCKNLMGCILPKNIMHSDLHKKIADLTHVLQPKLGIIDGIIGSDGYEEGGNPIEMNLIVASQDVVAADRVGSLIMGFEPEDAEYLIYAAQKGLGEIDLSKIAIIGESIAKVYKKFDIW